MAGDIIVYQVMVLNSLDRLVEAVYVLPILAL